MGRTDGLSSLMHKRSDDCNEMITGSPAVLQLVNWKVSGRNERY